MKRIMIYVFALVTAALFVASCENAKFLNQTPFSQTSPENFYNSETSMYMALISCYEIINGHKIPGATYVQRGSYGLGMLYIMNAPSDDVVAATSSSDEGLEMFWANYFEGTRCVREAWEVLYAGVSRCNYILHYIDGVGLDEETRVQYVAEARFLRAFFYYHLAWNFGGVPIVTIFDSDGQEPRSSLEEVYDFILEDLDYAYENLNETGILQTSSANKYTVAAYMARICNYLAACKRNGTGSDLVAEQPLNDFSFVDADAMSLKARDACEDVVMNSPYILLPDYTNLFRETTKSQQYQECMLLAEQPLSGSEGYWPNSFYLPSPTSTGAVCPNVYGGRYVPTPRAFYMYYRKDPRRDHNLTGRISDGYTEVEVEGYTYYNPNPDKATVNITDPVSGEVTVEMNPLYDNPETQTYLATSGIQVCPGKVRLCNVNQLQRTYQQHAFSFPLMRLADVYLMYAEALYFTGNETLGREYMDKVLERAVGYDDELFEECKAYYHRDDFIEELLESRERELIFEFSRKWDLIRFNIIDEKISSINPTMVEELVRDEDDPDYIDPKYLSYQTGGYLQTAIPALLQNWQHHKIWLPLSEEQMGVNKNLVQNAGW